MIKAVKLNFQPKFGEVKFEIGKEYESLNGFHFCDSAYATLEYEPFGNPLKTRYLEIVPLDDCVVIGDGHSFVSNKIRIVREIEKEELCIKEPNFKVAYDYFSDIAIQKHEEWKRDFNIQKKINELKWKLQNKRLKTALLLALIPTVVLVLLYILLPLALVYFGLV